MDGIAIHILDEKFTAIAINFLNSTKKKIILLITAVLAISLMTTTPASADVDPIQVALSKVMPELPLSPSHTSLTKARHQIGADWTIANGYTGQGVSVVVMDTGTQASHVQLNGRIIQEVCTSTTGQSNKLLLCNNNLSLDEGPGAAEYPKNPDGTPMPISNHGTMVSSTVLEFAPGVRIISLKWDLGMQSNALGWIAANAKKYNIAAVNMSFGGPYFPREGLPCQDSGGRSPWIDQVSKIKALGVAVVVAAGNDGLLSQLSHPACMNDVISVGAVLPTDKFALYSNVSSQLTLAAPTEFETATLPQTPTKNDEWISSFGGTSAATPVIVAMMAIGHSVAPTLSVNELVAVARSTSTSIDDLVVKDLRRVNFDKFVQRLLNLKVLSSITSVQSSKLTENSVTINWTVGIKPDRVRLTVLGQTPLYFPGLDGQAVINRPTATSAITVQVEALELDGSISSTKQLTITFPIVALTNWCNPTGTPLGTAAPFISSIGSLGPNKDHNTFVDVLVGGYLDWGVGYCRYIEFSPFDSPNAAYIARFPQLVYSSGLLQPVFVLAIPITFGSGGTMRVSNIDQKGNYSNISSYFLPPGMELPSTGFGPTPPPYAIDLQPELFGIVQKSLLIDKYVSADLISIGSIKDAIAKATDATAKATGDATQARADATQARADAAAAAAAATKATADAEAGAIATAKATADATQARADAEAAALATANATADATQVLQRQLDGLKRILATRKTITCVKGQVTQKVTGAVPLCPSGYSLKK